MLDQASDVASANQPSLFLKMNFIQWTLFLSSASFVLVQFTMQPHRHKLCTISVWCYNTFCLSIISQRVCHNRSLPSFHVRLGGYLSKSIAKDSTTKSFLSYATNYQYPVRHDIQHNNTQLNDTPHNVIQHSNNQDNNVSNTTLRIITLSIMVY